MNQLKRHKNLNLPIETLPVEYVEKPIINCQTMRLPEECGGPALGFIDALLDTIDHDLQRQIYLDPFAERFGAYGC